MRIDSPRSRCSSKQILFPTYFFNCKILHDQKFISTNLEGFNIANKYLNLKICSLLSLFVPSLKLFELKGSCKSLGLFWQIWVHFGYWTIFYFFNICNSPKIFVVLYFLNFAVPIQVWNQVVGFATYIVPHKSFPQSTIIFHVLMRIDVGFGVWTIIWFRVFPLGSWLHALVIFVFIRG